MRRAALVLFLLAAAAAADDGLKAFRDELRGLERSELKFWREFQRDYNDALLTLIRPYEMADAKPNDAINYVLDFSGMRSLYERHALIEQAKAKAALTLAASGDPKALDELLDAVLDAAKRIDDVEKDLLDARPQQRGYRFDQRPAVERDGLAIRLEGLVQALAQCPGAAAFLAADGMKAATRKDGRRSIVRRVAVLDALGLCEDQAALAALAPFAGAPESSLRIAALEGLLRKGAGARTMIEPLLSDPVVPVRRALLQGIVKQAADDPGWIAPVLSAYRDAQGLVREDAIRALEALTKQRYGDSLAGWEEWFADYRGEIEEGKFRKDLVEVREVAPTPLAPTCTFYGVGTPSRGVIFVIEGSRRIYWPADLDVQRREYKETWHGRLKTWSDEFPSQQAVLLREFDRASAGFAGDLSFGLVGLYGPFVAESMCGPKLLHPDKRDLRNARRQLEKLPADGWCTPYEGLVEAARLAGMGPESDANFPEAHADTVYLWSSGDCGSGRYMSPDAALAAFVRFNRFRRLVVHAIRISDEGEPSETFMKGVAEATGGSYVWATKPPR